MQITRGISQHFDLLLKLLLRLGLLVLSSCASAPEEPVNPRVHPAASVGDLFQVEQGMPIREVQQREFYFKHCELETRRPFTSKAEFSCNER